jgi:transcriptional regulator with XRE-family HTH domain
MPRRIGLNRPLSRPRRLTFIKAWREHRHLSQEQLASRLDMSAAQLSRIETGKQPYTQDFLEACAAALQTDVPSLLMRSPSDSEAIWSIWDQAKEGEREMIVDLAKTVLKRAG